MQHVVPADVVTKDDLLGMLAAAFGRSDLVVSPEPAPVAADRSLATRHPEINTVIWSAAGHREPPTARAMVEELATVAP